MTKKNKFLVRLVKEGRLQDFSTCIGNGRIENCEVNCPLFKIEKKCSEALKEYINTKLEPEDKLEFLVAIM